MRTGLVNILLLAWHPGLPEITAGGRRLCVEIVRRIDEHRITVIDAAPSFLRHSNNKKNISFLEYRIPPGLKRLEESFFFLERAMEWTLSSLFVLCKALTPVKRADVIYVPFSELWFLTLPAVFLGKLSRRTVLLKNLNIEFRGNTLLEVHADIKRLGKRPSISLVVAVLQFLLRKVNVWLHNRSDGVITLSESMKRKLIEHGVRQEKIMVNPVGMDLGPIESARPFDTEFDSIFIGRHVPEKGIFDLIRIWRLVTDRLPEAKLVTVGWCSPETRKTLSRQIRESNLEGKIIIQGIVSEQDKYGMLKSSRVCIFPSYVEGWGIVPIEALASGIPVIVYDLEVYRETVADSDSVFVVDRGDYSAMAARVLALLEDDGSTSEIIAKRKDIAARFDWNDVVRKEVRILRGVSGNSDRGLPKG